MYINHPRSLEGWGQKRDNITHNPVGIALPPLIGKRLQTTNEKKEQQSAVCCWNRCKIDQSSLMRVCSQMFSGVHLSFMSTPRREGKGQGQAQGGVRVGQERERESL